MVTDICVGSRMEIPAIVGFVVSEGLADVVKVVSELTASFPAASVERILKWYCVAASSVLGSNTECDVTKSYCPAACPYEVVLPSSTNDDAFSLVVQVTVPVL